MSSMTFEGNTSQVHRMLLRLETATNPAAIAGFLGAEVDPYLRSRARKRFASEGDDVVGRWLPLGEATQNIRATMGYGPTGPINVRTHELERYILDSPNSLSVHPWGATLTLPGNEATGELADKYATAQHGGMAPNAQRPTPPRPVLGMNSRDTLAVLMLLYGYIKGRAGS